MPLFLLQRCPESALLAGADQAWSLSLAGGRHLLMMHPHRWWEIIDFLTSEALPPVGWEPLLAQARILNLNPIVERLEARVPGVDFQCDSDAMGFSCRFVFVDVKNHLAKGYPPQKLSVNFKWGQRWTLQIEQERAFIQLVQLPARYDSSPSLVDLSLAVCLQPKDTGIHEQRTLREYRAGRHLTWALLGFSLDELLAEKISLARDAITFRLKFRFS